MYFITSTAKADLAYDFAMRVVEHARETRQELPDSVAMTLASCWGSPGSVGSWLAMLASTGSAPVPYLMADIRATMKEATDSEDKLALDQLATWLLHHESIAQARSESFGYVYCDCCGMDTIGQGVTEVNLCGYCDDAYCVPVLRRTSEGFGFDPDNSCPVMEEENA